MPLRLHSGFRLRSPRMRGPGLDLPLINLDFGLSAFSQAMSFSRATTATVTDHLGRVNVVKSGELRHQGLRRVENLLGTTAINSETLATAVPTGVTVTPGTADLPPGVGTSLLIAASGVGPQANRMNISLGTLAIGSTYTFACFAKAGTCSVGITFSNGGGGVSARSKYDLVTGTVAETFGTSAATTIAPVGNGWYWVTLTAPVSLASTRMELCLWDGTANQFSYPGSTTGAAAQIAGIHAAPASQLLASDYVSVGVVAGPAFHGAYVDGVRYFTTDEFGETIQEGVVGPPRTNLALRSEEFDNGSWAKSGTGSAVPVVTANAALSPTGSTTADRVDFASISGASQRSILSQSITVALAPHTLSVWMRTESGTATVYMGFENSNVFAELAASVTTTWQRFTVTGTPANTTTFVSIGPNSFAGTGRTQPSTQAAATVLMWGAQMETAAAATSYIPTSNAAVTRRDGVQEARTNILLRSEEFDNAAWTKGASAILTPNAAVSPDGTMDADRVVFTADAANADVLQNKTGIADGAMATGSAWIWADVPGTTVLFILRNSAGGAITSQILTLTTTPTRYSLSGTTSGASSGLRFRADAGGLNRNIYLWGAQLEAGFVATSYIPTTSAAVTRPMRFPREGVLIEEARTNLCQQSLTPSTQWNVAGITLAANQTGITGVANQAITITDDGLNSQHYLSSASGPAYVVSQAYALTAYVKPGTATRVQLTITGNSFTAAYANFSLVGAGSVLATGAGMASPTITLMSDGFYRISGVVTATATTAGTCLMIAFIDSDTAARLPTFTGTGLTLIFGGGQTEAGAFPTSIIPTTGAVTTRNADNLSFTLPPSFSATQGTWLVDYKHRQVASSVALEGANGGVSGVIIGASNLDATAARAADVHGADRNIHYFASGADGRRIKTAISVAGAASVAASNGSAPASTAAVAQFDYATAISVGSRDNSALYLNNPIRSIRWYPRAMTQEQLNALTT